MEKQLAKIDPERLTIGEVAFIEDQTGMTFTNALENLSAKTMQALAACIIRRTDSTETSESALAKAELLTVGDLMEAIQID
ncbi:MAG: hypothetical protein E7A24_05790 [Varibaculum cambriense]|uniref:hypothetical protein n=1 Tax=Varibaculum cambriense TaxID=184870 RepID=UPI0028FEBE84|nr:hypothetical protein [Varibaculum cambriense]MDU1051694.1 hypothetical protein [Varibaculum cambriense]